MALCDDGAYLLSVAALRSPSPKEGGCSFNTPMLVWLAESARANVRRGWAYNSGLLRQHTQDSQTSASDSLRLKWQLTPIFGPPML